MLAWFSHNGDLLGVFVTGGISLMTHCVYADWKTVLDMVIIHTTHTHIYIACM